MNQGRAGWALLVWMGWVTALRLGEVIEDQAILDDSSLEDGVLWRVGRLRGVLCNLCASVGVDSHTSTS